jgi:hypothetical protein
MVQKGDDRALSKRTEMQTTNYESKLSKQGLESKRTCMNINEDDGKKTLQKVEIGWWSGLSSKSTCCAILRL